MQCIQGGPFLQPSAVICHCTSESHHGEEDLTDDLHFFFISSSSGALHIGCSVLSEQIVLWSKLVNLPQGSQINSLLYFLRILPIISSASNINKIRYVRVRLLLVCHV